MRATSTSRNSSINSLMRTRKLRSYSKISMLKKIFNRHNSKKESSGKKKRNPYTLLLKRIFVIGTFIFLLIVLAGSIVVAVWIGNISKELVGIDPDTPFKNAGNEGDTLIFANDNKTELKRLTGLESRDFIKIDDVPDYVKAAFVAAEDKSFYENKGVDFFGIARAALGALQHKEIVGGGSTITQQVVKNTLVGDKQDLNRKLKELILSVQIAQKYNKNQVLQLYINSIPFGSNFIGIKRAAKAYFNKDVKDLSYAEAALLAGIPNNPARLAPDPYIAVPEDQTYETVNGEKIKANVVREREILSRMDEIADQLAVYPGIKLDKQKIKDARDEKIAYNFPKTEAKAPHFTAENGPVYNELKDIFKDQPNVDEYITSRGLRVYTTLDYDMQQRAEDSVAQIDDNTNQISASVCAYCRSGVSNPTPWNVFGAKNSAMISVDPKTGAILAYAGSAGFDRNDPDGYINGQVDILQQGVSQGSSMKPFNYMNTFMQKNLSPTSVWANFPLNFAEPGSTPYIPKNFSIGDHPAISVSSSFALNNSLNIPAVQSLLTGGVDNYATLLGKMGYSDDEVAEIKKAGLTATLGSAVVKPYDHAQAYQVLANGGVRKNLYTIQRVTDKDGNELYHKQDDAGTRIVDEKYAWLIYSILKDYPTVRNVKSDGYDVAGKTGTNDFGPGGLPTSNVFWGFTPDLLTGIWAGNSNNKPLKALAVGEKLGQFLWVPYMRAVLPKFPKDKFTRPAGIVEKTVCTDTGFLKTDPNNPCPSGTGLFIDGKFPKADDNHKNFKVVDCNGTLKLASNQDIFAGLARDQFFVKYESNTGVANIQRQIDDYANKNGQPQPPTDTCNIDRTTNGNLLLRITSPSSGSNFNTGDTINISADGLGSGTITGKFYFDDNFIKQDSNSPMTATVSVNSGISSGTHTIKVVATDSNGTTGTATVTVNINSSTSGNTPVVTSGQITSPTDGYNNSRVVPINFVASALSNAKITGVKFRIYKNNNKLDREIDANSEGGNVYANRNWSPIANGLQSGTYYIKLYVQTDSGQSFESNQGITINLS